MIKRDEIDKTSEGAFLACSFQLLSESVRLIKVKKGTILPTLILNLHSGQLAGVGGWREKVSRNISSNYSDLMDFLTILLIKSLCFYASPVMGYIYFIKYWDTDVEMKSNSTVMKHGWFHYLFTLLIYKGTETSLTKKRFAMLMCCFNLPNWKIIWKIWASQVSSEVCFKCDLLKYRAQKGNQNWFYTSAKPVKNQFQCWKS